jgi:hypothetical protein
MKDAGIKDLSVDPDTTIMKVCGLFACGCHRSATIYTMLMAPLASLQCLCNDIMQSITTSTITLFD